jgi:CBS domain-containing protein
MRKVKNIENFIVDLNSNGLDCLTKLELNSVKTLLVIKDGFVLGTITDGDIRKVLINNHLITMPVKYIMNNDYFFGLNKKECQDIFKKHYYIFLVPQIDGDRKLIEIYTRDI